MKSIGAVSERSHFPLAKIKHFTRSCQILIRRKLAEEYHFPKTNRSSVSPPWVVSPSPSPSPTLISSSVISSRLNANSEEAGAAFHSNRSFVMKNPCRRSPYGPAGAGCCLKRRGWGLRFAPAPGSNPRACQRPHVHTDASPSWISESDLTKTIFAFLACSLCSWLNRGKKKRKKEDTHRTEHKEMCRRQQPTQDSLVGEKRAARRQHQHRFCSHRSAGNYDNNVFPRQLLSDLVSEHLPFLKSPPDNIWYDYKVKILFKERPLMCL